MKIAIVGGSLGGLLTAFALTRTDQHQVDVYERTPQTLASRGAGIRIQPVMVDALQKLGLDLSANSAFTNRLKYLDAQGGVELDSEERGQFTSWGRLYRALLDEVPAASYHVDHMVEAVATSDDGVELTMASGVVATADLVVFVDGITSLGRRLIDPSAELTYAGYVAWRGFVDEADLSAEAMAVVADSTTYAVGDHSHIVFYPMPAADGGPALINYVWYRNVAAGPDFDALTLAKSGRPSPISVHPGQVRDEFVEEMRETARRTLPPTAAELVVKTVDPFVQPLYDLEVQRMRDGRLLVLGDAAFVARPHAGAGTAKAAANAVALAEALDGVKDYGAAQGALERWEVDGIELGRSLVARCIAIGDAYQLTGDVTPGDPALQFGLYGPGW